MKELCLRKPRLHRQPERHRNYVRRAARDVKPAQGGWKVYQNAYDMDKFGFGYHYNIVTTIMGIFFLLRQLAYPLRQGDVGFGFENENRVWKISMQAPDPFGYAIMKDEDLDGCTSFTVP